ncbi:MAG: hypothetical protein AAF770_00350 [Bacteroidota bacterium]
MDILTPHIGLIFWQTIILVVAYLVLRKFAWKPILSFITQQEKKYTQALKEEEEARKTAQRMHLMAEKLIEKANQKKSKLIQKAQAAQKALIAEAKLSAEEEYNTIIKKAKEDIKKEEKLALQAFKKKAGILVIDASQKILKRELQNENIQKAVLAKLLKEGNIERAN